VIYSTTARDDQLRGQLEGLTREDRDYWSFKGNSRREHGHGLFQYPAMMVPQVVRAVLQQACAVHPEIDSIADPFVGSGTILTEAMLRGLSFAGIDCNPLAVLVCRVKEGPFFVNSLGKKIEELTSRVSSDHIERVDVAFPNLDKWFRLDVQIALSRIRRGILQERSLWARRFLWIGLAEVVRLTSNSRTSTYKLHVRPADEIGARKLDPIGLFFRTILRNLGHFTEQGRFLQDHGYLVRGRYQRKIDVRLGDARRPGNGLQTDIVITSPPYGDNTSTVPYGQYSYLPLQWIDIADIDPAAGNQFLRSTCEIDARGLGGVKRVTSDERYKLTTRSPALANCLDLLTELPADRGNRVAAFARDLDRSLDPILASLRVGGLFVWILGNRRVGGRRVPLDEILIELLAPRHVNLLCRLSRRISSKRMAPKNNIADTMSSESILVMRKVA